MLVASWLDGSIDHSSRRPALVPLHGKNDILYRRFCQRGERGIGSDATATSYDVKVSLGVVLAWRSIFANPLTERQPASGVTTKLLPHRLISFRDGVEYRETPRGPYGEF